MKSGRDYHIIKALQAVEEDWMDLLHFSKEYFKAVADESADDDKVTKIPDWAELKAAYLDMKHAQEMYRKYKDLIIEDKLEEALYFAESFFEEEYKVVGLF